MEKIRNNIPILSALLIFIGYLNYQFYYTNFDIEINSYLTTSELIFSFLPLTIPFLLIISTLIFLSTGLEFAIERKDRETEFDREIETPLHAISRIQPAWSRMVRNLKREDKRTIDWITLPISVLIFIMSIAVAAFMVAYIFIFIHASTTSDFTTIDFTDTLILGVIWLVFIFIKIDLNEKENSKKWSRSFGYALLITVSIGLLRIAKTENASNILKGQAEYKASINLQGSNITTDSTIVYIGQTSEYLFLRNRRNDENIILKIGDIRKYTLTKLRKEKGTE
jgi:hypothetical protein